MSERYLENEDNLNSLIVNLRNLIKRFSTLSRDKIENVILTANTMIKEGENNLKIMEEEVNNLGIQQQFGSKLKNYKMEFQNLLSKFQSSQDKYINQKANKAIILVPKFIRLILVKESGKLNPLTKGRSSLFTLKVNI